jgi:hypothetical protein
VQAGRFVPVAHAPGVQRPQRLRIGDELGLHPLTPGRHQRVGKRGAVAQVLHQQEAGLGIGTEQPGRNWHRHGLQVIQGGQFGTEKPGTLRTMVSLPALAFQDHGTARGEVQPDNVAAVPDLFRGLHHGRLAQGLSQQRLSRPLVTL